MPSVLEINDIHTYYGTIHALKGISLEVREGEIVTLIGANGAGKSTTLRSINGLNHPREGRIIFQDMDITETPPHDIVQMGISPSVAGLYAEMARAINDGRVRSVEGRRLENTTPTTFEAFADTLARAYQTV